MSNFSTYNHFVHVRDRVYRIHQTHPLQWKIGHKASPYTLYFWPTDTADVTIPWYAEPLVWLGVIDPHDVDLIAAAFVHDKLLRDGFDRPFAAAEFRRALSARGWKGPVMRTLAYLAVLLHTAGEAGHPA